MKLRDFQWRVLAGKLWLRATVIGALGVLAAVLATVAEHVLPFRIPLKLDVSAIDSILSIIASSMLAVTTFSLSVMTSAYGAATTNVTPRATKLVMEDQLTLNVLSTFIGSFLFGMTGIIVLRTGAYGENGRAVLFVMTIGVIALIVIMLLRWIDHLTKLGRMGFITDRLEQATQEAIEIRISTPFLGANALRELPPQAVPLKSDRIGYLQHVDLDGLQAMAAEEGIQIYLHQNPGAFLFAHTPLAHITREVSQATQAALQKAFIIGIDRTFEQDPRFGLAVMAEVGSRALSPATNDAGTAINVIGRLTRLLSLWADSPDRAQADIDYPNLYVPPLKDSDLFEDAFMIMARDGAHLIEVQIRLIKALSALSRQGDADFRAAALAQAQIVLQRGLDALTFEGDRETLTALYATSFPPAPSRIAQTKGITSQ